MSARGSPDMRLINSTRGAVLAEHVERAGTIRDRLRGLLGRSVLPEGRALAIAPCNAVHTFFMKFPIDAVFLDRRGRVVRTVPELPPWRATRFHFRAVEVVELPAGTLARTGTRVGDELVFRESGAV